MNNVQLTEILSRLGPNFQPPYIGYAFLPSALALYAMFFLALITQSMQKTSTLTITMLMTTVMMATLIDKVAVGVPGGLPATGTASLPVFILRAPMFTFPLIVAGMTKSPKSRLPAILGGLIGGAYLFLRWFVDQRL